MISRPKFLKKYLCIRRFEAQSDSELSLKVGQVVELLDKDRSGWWLVYSYDRKGYVPGSHLIAMDASDERDGESSTEAASELCIAIKGYNARRPDELSLHAGSHVEIISKSEDGWWMVRTVGENPIAGRYPAMYLKSMLNKHEKLSKTSSSDLTRSNSKRVAFFNFPALRRQQQNMRNSHSVDTLRNSVHVKTSSNQYFAVDSHDDIYGDSLSFRRGDKVTVLRKTGTGWWYVSIEGKEGWAPSSYLTQQDPTRPCPLSNDLTKPVKVLHNGSTEPEKAPDKHRLSRVDAGTHPMKVMLDRPNGVAKIFSPCEEDNSHVKAKECTRRAEESIVNAALNDFTASVMHELKAKLSSCNGHIVAEPSVGICSRGVIGRREESADNKLYALMGRKQQRKIKWI